MAALKARKPPFQETTEKLESLRQKQEEVQKHEEDFKRDYNFRIDQLRIFEDELKQKEVSVYDFMGVCLILFLKIKICFYIYFNLLPCAIH